MKQMTGGARLRTAAFIGLLIGMPAQGKHQQASFTYKFVMTPEEGPLDPAIEKRYTAQFRACQKRAFSTVENEACLTAEFERQDRKLNHSWRVKLDSLTPELRLGFVRGQQKWVARRDPFCNSGAEKFRGGTIAPVVYVDCRIEQTIRRTIWIEKLQQ